jgi:uroporphyrinogen-III synthase
MPTVWLLRPRPQVEALAFLLEEEGASPVFVPVLSAAAPADGRALSSAAEQLARFPFVAPDAPQAVRALVFGVHAAGTRAILERVRWLCPDAETARAVELSGFGGHLVAPGRPEAWTEAVPADDEVLVLHEAERQPRYCEALRGAGVAVTTVGAWRRQAEWSLDAFPAPDVVVVHSPIEGEALLQALPGGGSRELRFVAAGPATARALRQLGARVCAVASTPAADGVLEATLRALSGTALG